MTDRQTNEIVVLRPGSFIYKGTKKDTDPLASTFYPGLAPTQCKWFADQPSIAEYYSHPTGWVWVYKVTQPIYLLHVYDASNPESTRNSLSIINRVIDRYTTPDVDPDGDKRASLKHPFGLLSLLEQSFIDYTKLHVPITDEHNQRNQRALQALASQEKDAVFDIQGVHRNSFHDMDKELALFLANQSSTILDGVHDLMRQRGTATSSVPRIDGYFASSWPSMWYGKKGFDSELCVFDTVGKLDPTCKYQVLDGVRQVHSLATPEQCTWIQSRKPISPTQVAAIDAEFNTCLAGPQRRCTMDQQDEIPTVAKGGSHKKSRRVMSSRR